MAQMGGTSTTVEWLTTALCLDHGEKLLRGNNASTSEKNGTAMGAIERRSGTTQSPATCELAKSLNSSLRQPFDELLHLFGQQVRTHCEHLIAFRTYDPNHQRSWRNCVVPRVLTKEFFETPTGYIPLHSWPMGATNGERHPGRRHHWIGKKFAPQHISPHLDTFSIESGKLVRSADSVDQAERRARPFARRDFNTARPARVLMRARKPCFFARRCWFG